MRLISILRVATFRDVLNDDHGALVGHAGTVTSNARPSLRFKRNDEIGPGLGRPRNSALEQAVQLRRRTITRSG